VLWDVNQQRVHFRGGALPLERQKEDDVVAISNDKGKKEGQNTFEEISTLCPYRRLKKSCFARALATHTH
jgi:hypothetical protein